MNNIMLAIRNTSSGSEHNLFDIKFKEELNPFGRWFKSS